MTVTADLKGRVYPETAPYLVGREKVREFARAVGSTDPLSLDPAAAEAAGFADVVAPPTFAIVLQDPTLRSSSADETAGVDFSRVVHGDQRFRFTRPIVAGDLLTATMTVTDVKSLGGNGMVTAESAIRDAAAARRHPDLHDRDQGRLVSDEILAVGDVVASGHLPIARDMLVRYAGASGDFNPIHYRDDVAVAVGLPGVLAHGMLTMGLAVQPSSTLRCRPHPRLRGAVHPTRAGAARGRPRCSRWRRRSA